jgi:hypothetical protein
MTKWKPAKRVPMLGNGPRIMLGQIQALPVLIRWGLPWLLTAGGIALTSYVATKAVPEIPINKQKIGLAAALGGGGFTAYLLSSTMPDDWKPVAYAAAVAGISAGAYFLFSTPEKTDADRVTPSPRINSDEVIPQYTPGPMLQNFLVQTDPKQIQTSGTWRQPFGNQTFDVLVSNNSNQPFTFFTGVKMYGSDQALMYTTPTSAPTYGRTKTTVAPGAQEVVKVTIPKPADWDGAKNPGNDNALQFEFFRQQTDPTPFKISDAIPIYYTYASGLEAILGVNTTRPSGPVEFHDETNPYHVMGCKKCRGKKKKPKPMVYTLPTVPLTQPPSGMV